MPSTFESLDDVTLLPARRVYRVILPFRRPAETHLAGTHSFPLARRRILSILYVGGRWPVIEYERKSQRSNNTAAEMFATIAGLRKVQVPEGRKQCFSW